MTTVLLANYKSFIYIYTHTHFFFIILCSECVLTYQVHDMMRYQKLGDM